MAAKNGHADIVAALLKAGADMEAEDCVSERRNDGTMEVYKCRNDGTMEVYKCGNDGTMEVYNGGLSH